MTGPVGPPDLPRRPAAEGLGTGLLVACVVGPGIVADALTADTALALLANTLATGAILVVLIMTLGPLSGAHFNPAVAPARSLTDMFAGIRPLDLPGFVAAQLGGALAALILMSCVLKGAPSLDRLPGPGGQE